MIFNEMQVPDYGRNVSGSCGSVKIYVKLNFP